MPTVAFLKFRPVVLQVPTGFLKIKGRTQPHILPNPQRLQRPFVHRPADAYPPVGIERNEKSVKEGIQGYIEKKPVVGIELLFVRTHRPRLDVARDETLPAPHVRHGTLIAPNRFQFPTEQVLVLAHFDFAAHGSFKRLFCIF